MATGYYTIMKAYHAKYNWYHVVDIGGRVDSVYGHQKPTIIVSNVPYHQAVRELKKLRGI